jgi:hypothetical protein
MPPTPDERISSTLTAEQITRIAAHRRRRTIAPGDLLVEVGGNIVPFVLGATLCCDNSLHLTPFNTPVRAGIWSSRWRSLADPIRRSLSRLSLVFGVNTSRCPDCD